MNTIFADEKTVTDDPSLAIEVKLQLCDYKPQTINAYLGQLRAFFRYVKPLDPRRFSSDELRAYLVHLNERGKSRSTTDQTVQALRFLWREFYDLPFPLEEEDIPRPQRKDRVPVLLTQEEVKRIAIAAENLKHRLMIELAYSAGLRVSEVVNVRAGDVNLLENTLFVRREGRPGEGRNTIFSYSLGDAISRQIGMKQPDDFLFPSQRGGKLTTRTFAKYFRAALEASAVVKEATPYSLRHSFATSLLRNGSNVPTVQNLLGHARRESTRFYAKTFSGGQ